MKLDANTAKALSQAETLDYQAIGFRCGLEIHQQLDTDKLFSPCPSDVLEPDEIPSRATAVVERQLRATGSESGQVDVAALAEAAKGHRFAYVALEGLASLVELDEEPPHALTPDALAVGLSLAGLVSARPVDEVHVMRKTVIDGSNTSGFQRTALFATGGTVEVPGGNVGIWTMALEEDSARKLEAEEAAKIPGWPTNTPLVGYALDRLGIPLIEIATAPDIVDPDHAQRTAARIGALLRCLERPDGRPGVKRGLGTIRQDLNVSVAVGDRVEIKGCQDLRAIPRVIAAECRRQLWMHHVMLELQKQNARVGDIHNVSSVFAKTAAKSVKSGLENGVMLGLVLHGFAGLLRGATKDGPRLGRELADHAKVAAGVKGLFHSDELPAYGITQEEVDACRKALHCQPSDAFLLVVGPEAIARRALQAAGARAAQALVGPVKEVRACQPDDSSRFMRPMPGSARMYPETDVPPIRIPAARWQDVIAHLPPKPEARVARLVQSGLHPELAGQLVAEGHDAVFREWVAAGAEGNLASRVLLQLLPALKHPKRVMARVPDVFAKLASGAFAKEAVPDVLAALDADAAQPLEAVLAKLNVESADADTIDAVIERVIATRLDFVRERGMAAMGPLMGPVMAELRGKADGSLISERLKHALSKPR